VTGSKELFTTKGTKDTKNSDPIRSDHAKTFVLFVSFVVRSSCVD